MPKTACPNEDCGSNDTWATYICPVIGKTDKPGESHTKPFQWYEEAIGPLPDGVPNSRPCPGCTSDTPPAFANCGACGHSWTWDSEGQPVPL